MAGKKYKKIVFSVITDLLGREEKMVFEAKVPPSTDEVQAVLDFWDKDVGSFFNVKIRIPNGRLIKCKRIE